MVSKISFGSTYKVSSSNNNINNYAKFKAFAEKMHETNNIYLECKDKMKSTYPYEYQMDCTVVAPNCFDDNIERYCANNAITYSKFSPAMSTEALQARVAEAPLGKIKVNVNAKKLEAICQVQNSNIKDCQNDYNKYFHNNVHIMLKKGEKFPTSTLYISADDTENAIRYINKFGADNLNNKQLFIDFSQRTNMPDHCVYFALRNAGIKEVPVYVDESTLKIGEALGIFE